MMLLVGIGGACGAVMRYLLGKWISSKTTTDYPFGTWMINISGSFALGVIIALYMNYGIPKWTWILLGIGFLGSYTTFSTFGYEIYQLLQKKKKKLAVMYALSSVVFGVAFAFIGILLGIAII